jgi:Fe2+ or Zn2+ uptake regulation protein
MDQQRHGVKTEAIGRGYRQTAQRAMVLAEVQAAEGHPTAGEIFARVRRRDPRVAYGTVYRSLHLLARHGLIQELTFADEASRYDGRVERHDHVLCTGCGLLVDVDVPIALIARHVAEERSGFAISSHHTVFAGTCPSCRRTDGVPAGPTDRRTRGGTSF